MTTKKAKMTFPAHLATLLILVFSIIIVLGVSSEFLVPHGSSLIAIFLFLMTCYFILKDIVLYSILLLYFFYQLSQIVSVCFLDFGSVYAPEIQLYSSSANYALLLFIYSGVFVVSVAMVARSKLARFVVGRVSVHKFRPKFYSSPKLFFVLLIFLFGFFILYGLFSGFPLLSGQKRFEYWTVVPFAWFVSKVLYLIPFLSVVLGYLYNWEDGYRKKIIFLNFILCLVGLLYSNKFTWFVNYFLLFSMGGAFAYFGSSRRYKYLISQLGIMVVVFIVLIVLSSVGYLFLHNYNIEELGGMVFSRIFAMQGQVWWFILSDLPTSPIENLSLIFQKPTNSEPYGMFHMMMQIMPSQSFEYYFEHKIPLSSGFPAMILYGAGFILAVPILVFLSILYVYVMLYVFVATKTLCIFRIFLAVFMLSVLPWAFLLGSTYVLFTPLFVAVLIVSAGDSFLIVRRLRYAV